MANFAVSRNITKEHEGGFWNDKSAGWTYAGITRNYSPNWPGFKRLEQLKAIYFPRTEIPRYTVFNDRILEQQVSDHMKATIWGVMDGDKINNQQVANFMYDFIVHKMYDAIAVINDAALSVNDRISVNRYKVSADVIQAINRNPVKFYSALRTGRINYYLTKKTKSGKNLFSKPLQKSLLQRVNKFPASLTGSAASGYTLN